MLYICCSLPLWLIEAVWRFAPWSAPSHYLNRCWCIVNWTLSNKLQWNFNRNSNIFIKENAFWSVVCEKAVFLCHNVLKPYDVLHVIAVHPWKPIHYSLHCTCYLCKQQVGSLHVYCYITAHLFWFYSSYHWGLRKMADILLITIFKSSHENFFYSNVIEVCS